MPHFISIDDLITSQIFPLLHMLHPFKIILSVFFNLGTVKYGQQNLDYVIMS